MKTFCYICVAALVSLWVAANTTEYLTGDPLVGDAKQNTLIAYHFVHTGVYSRDKVEAPGPNPTMRREPVPILALSALLLLHPSFAEPYKIVDLAEGRLTRDVKLVNVFWRFLVALFIFLLCLELFPNPIAAGAAALTTLVISDLTFMSDPATVDTLFTELPAAALLLASCWCAVRFVHDGTKSRAICLGIALGLLTLTKAAFFYIGIVFVLLLFFLELRKVNRKLDTQSMRHLRITYVLLAAAFLTTLAPWVLRNVSSFGTPAIATRGASVLGHRMILADQPPLGLIYASSPLPLQQRFGRLMGYSPADLEAGGRLSDISFLKLRRGDIYKAKMQAEGYVGTTHSWLMRSAAVSVVEHPLRYLQSVGIFAYRGMWFMRPSGLMLRIEPMTFYALSALSVVCFLAVFFCGLIKGNTLLVAAFGLGVGAFLFHSALTHAITRYNAPLTPLVVISVLWVCVAAGRFLRRPRDQVSLPEMSGQKPT